MKAVVQNTYGPPELLQVKEVDPPTIGDDEVLVRVKAAGLHAGDYFTAMGEPYIARFFAGWPRPKDYIVGEDVAGVVEAVGAGVSTLSPGDSVYGESGHSCAQYTAAAADRFARMPGSLTFVQAAAVPVSALAALQGLRDAGKVQPGQKVLINGASGGVGTFAVQIAKALGAEVTGVCSGRNVELVRSLGADHVVDYTQEDFTQGGPRYDLILDNVGNRSFSECKRALTSTGVLLPNTGHAGLGYILKAFVRSLYERRQGRPVVSSPKPEDLATLTKMIEAEQIRPVVERTYSLDETPEALAYVGTRHASGKVVIVVDV